MTTFTSDDLKQLQNHGISTEQVEAQLARFRNGFPYLRLEGACEKGRGIMPVDSDIIKACAARWEGFLNDGGDVLKFVPASGAASRMFKALFSFVNGDEPAPAPGSDVAQLVDRIKDFAFYGQLCRVIEKNYGTTPEKLIEVGRYKDLVDSIILPEGLNYGQLPKALLTFHRYADDNTTRLSLEEQLAEGAQYAGSNGKVRVHFTVSADHRKLFEDKLKEVVPAMEKRFGVKYEISLSEQKPSTDTIAATPDNEIFRNSKGELVFRPGGHGALIENLNDIDADVVFIKNIDNVVPDAHRASTIEYKKLIGGLLLLVADSKDAIEKELRAATGADLAAACDKADTFLKQVLTTYLTEQTADPEERRRVLLRLLDRPLRVCGMVRNEGEPGGGPFLAHSTDGKTIAPQILESTQIDKNDPAAAEMMANSGYFNPVDLVCRLKRADGSHYHLPDFVDPATGFISSKSSEGRELKALELPGLWNGAMSDWNTVFVEVPADTFNPVKTVNDLLRPAHQ